MRLTVRHETDPGAIAAALQLVTEEYQRAGHTTGRYLDEATPAPRVFNVTILIRVADRRDSGFRIVSEFLAALLPLCIYFRIMSEKIADDSGSPVRAVLTGLSAILSSGLGAEAVYQACLRAETGVRRLTQLGNDFPLKLGAELPDDQYELDYLTSRERRRYSRNSRAAVAAFRMASQDADLEFYDPYRTCVYLAAAGEGFGIIEQTIRKSPQIVSEYGKIDPFGFHKAGYPAPGAAVCLAAGVRNYDPVSLSCASSVIAAAKALSDIRRGAIDRAIIVAVDFPIVNYVMTGFCSANAYTFEEDPETAVRPFATDPKKSRRPVPGEGAVGFIMERSDLAMSRGARIYAEVEDAHWEMENRDEMFLLDETGAAWANVLSRVAKNRPIAYINSHGCGDPYIDAAEARAYNLVFGKKQPVASSQKGLLGSAWAVGGASQMIITAKSIESGVVPGTQYCPEVDPELKGLGLNLAIKSVAIPRFKKGESALVVSHGFTGVNAAARLKRFVA